MSDDEGGPTVEQAAELKRLQQVMLEAKPPPPPAAPRIDTEDPTYGARMAAERKAAKAKAKKEERKQQKQKKKKQRGSASAAEAAEAPASSSSSSSSSSPAAAAAAAAAADPDAGAATTGEDAEVTVDWEVRWRGSDARATAYTAGSASVRVGCRGRDEVLVSLAAAELELVACHAGEEVAFEAAMKAQAQRPVKPAEEEDEAAEEAEEEEEEEKEKEEEEEEEEEEEDAASVADAATGGRSPDRRAGPGGGRGRRRSSTLLALQAEQWRSDDLGLALLQEEERVLSVINQQIHACVTLIYMQVASKHTQRKAIQEAMVTYLDTMSTDDGHAVVELVEMQRLLDRRASAQEQDVERAIQTKLDAVAQIEVQRAKVALVQEQVGAADDDTAAAAEDGSGGGSGGAGGGKLRELKRRHSVGTANAIVSATAAQQRQLTQLQRDLAASNTALEEDVDAHEAEVERLQQLLEVRMAQGGGGIPSPRLPPGSPHPPGSPGRGHAQSSSDTGTLVELSDDEGGVHGDTAAAPKPKGGCCTVQ